MLLNRSSTRCPACPSSTQGGKDLSRARGLARSNARAIMRAGVASQRPAIPGTVSISCHCRNGIASAISSAVKRCSGPASTGSGACVRSASRHRASIGQSVSLPNCTAFRWRCRAPPQGCPYPKGASVYYKAAELLPRCWLVTTGQDKRLAGEERDTDKFGSSEMLQQAQGHH
jgi:hypothetical protein